MRGLKSSNHVIGLELLGAQAPLDELPCKSSMAAKSTAPVIIRDPDILSGMPVFAGTRVPAQNLLDYLEHGRSIEEFLYDFPTVRRDQVIAALEGSAVT